MTMTAFVTESAIAHGLKNDEFALYYQPKVCLVTDRIVGAEALVRWELPDGNVLSPAGFIPTILGCGLITELTLHLLTRLIHDLSSFDVDAGLQVSFNVTAEDFVSDVLTDAILRAIDNRRLSPAALELEITETQALAADESVLNRIHALVDAGVGLAMDDYGIGYSSLDTLSKWPFTTIKLDRGIVGRMLDSNKSGAIVRSSIRLGHELGLNVVAEGVESTLQRDFLAEAGCRMIQGHLTGRAVPLDAFQLNRRQKPAGRGIPVGHADKGIGRPRQCRPHLVAPPWVRM